MIDDQVENSLFDIVILVLKFIIEIYFFLRLDWYLYIRVLTSDVDVPINRLANLGKSQNSLTCWDKRSDSSRDLLPFKF